MSHAPQPSVPVPPVNTDAPQTPQLHNDSTSSSNATSPTGDVPEIYRSLQVRVWENQRWFPIIGWSTSRLPSDPPNLSPWDYLHRGHAHTSPNVEALHRELMEANNIALSPEGTQRPQQPIHPLSLRLPEGYMWDGYWEISKQHHRGTDDAGWRYAENFTTAQPDGTFTAAHFKKSQTPTCVVRRRMWQRRVRLIKSGPTDSSPTFSDAYGGPASEEERTREGYLKEKQEEMDLAEKLKARRQATIDKGGEWTQEDELTAEEELRSFIRERRQRFTESATRRLTANNSFSNPFQPSGQETVLAGTPDGRPASEEHSPSHGGFTPGRYEGAVAASTWAVDSALNRARGDNEAAQLDVSDDDEFVRELQQRQLAAAEGNVAFEDESRPTRPDGVQSQDAAGLTFQHHEPSPREGGDEGHPSATDEPPLQTQSTINRFVAASTDNDDEDTATSPAGVGETNDFNAIFSKFMSNPDFGADAPK